MRNPVEVAEKIQKAVPEEYKGVFDWFINDFSYKPEEQYPDCFGMLHGAVAQMLKTDHGTADPKEDWHFEVCSILSTKSVEELRVEFGLRN